MIKFVWVLFLSSSDYTSENSHLPKQSLFLIQVFYCRLRTVVVRYYFVGEWALGVYDFS